MTDSRSGVMDRSDTPTSTSPWPTASSRPMRSYSRAFQVSPRSWATSRHKSMLRPWNCPVTPLVTKGGATTTPTRRGLTAGTAGGVPSWGTGSAAMATPTNNNQHSPVSIPICRRILVPLP